MGCLFPLFICIEHAVCEGKTVGPVCYHTTAFIAAFVLYIPFYINIVHRNVL